MFKQILWSFGLEQHAALNMGTNIMEEHSDFNFMVEENSMFLWDIHNHLKDNMVLQPRRP